MKKILLLFLIGFIFGQNDNIGSEGFNLTAERLFHAGYEKDFSDGTYLFKSSTDRTTVDTSGMFITDTTVGAALGSRLLQGGEIIHSSAADLDLLLDMVSGGYTIVIDSSGYLLDVPRTVYGWSHDLAFRVTDYNTIRWTSGNLYFANLDTFEIVSGNTGNISDITWIYFDENASSTVLQTTTEAGNSVGLGKVTLCVAEDVASPKLAIFQVFGNSGNGVFIIADNIAANTITGNEILANSITTNEIFFGSMTDSILYVINASVEGLNISGDRINITGATTFATGYNPSDGSMVIYQFSAPGTRPSGDALQNGDSWIDTTSAQGNIPKIWTGSEWRIAFTYIHGGYIKTGTIDVGRINAIASSGSGARIVIDPATDKIYFYNATQEVLRIGEDIFGSIDGLSIDSGMVYISTKDNSAYSQLHIEKYAQYGTGWQGLQTLYLSNDASSNVTANPTNSWVVSKIEGERNNVNKALYGTWANINNSGTGTAPSWGAYYNVDANDGISYGVQAISNSIDGTAYGINSFGASTNGISYGVTGVASGTGSGNFALFGNASGAATTNYGVYGLADNASTNWAGYFANGNVNINNTLLFGSGGDVNLYRDSPNILRTNDSFYMGGTMYFGDWDTNLYRSTTNVLKTDDKFDAVLGFQMNGTPGQSGTLMFDDGTNFRVTLVFSGGLLTGHTVAASSGGGAVWTP